MDETKKTFKEFVDQEVKSAAARGGLVLGGATLAEAETGALQEVNDIFSKKFCINIRGVHCHISLFFDLI